MFFTALFAIAKTWKPFKYPQTAEWIKNIRLLLLPVAKLCLTLCNPMKSSTPDFPNLHNLPEFAQTHSHWVSDAKHLFLCCPFLAQPSVFLRIRVFSNERFFTSGGQSIGGSAFSTVQSLSHVWLFVTPWIAARQASLSITISQSSLRLTYIGYLMLSSHLILGHPLLLLPPIPPSIRVFSNESTLNILGMTIIPLTTSTERILVEYGLSHWHLLSISKSEEQQKHRNT